MPSQELSHFSLAVEDKNTFFAFFKKIYEMIWLKNGCIRTWLPFTGYFRIFIVMN